MFNWFFLFRSFEKVCRWAIPRSFGFEDPDQLRRARLILAMSFLSSVIFLGFSPFCFSNLSGPAFLIVGVLSLFAPLIFKKTTSLAWSGNFLMTLWFIALLAKVESFTSLVGIALVPMFATALAGRKPGALWAACSFVFLLCFSYVRGIEFFHVTEMTFMLFANTLFALYFEKSKDTAYRKFRISREQLRLQHAVVDSTVGDLRKMQTKLVDSQKMVALGEMSGGIAHEINTPLAAIQLYAEMNSNLLMEQTLDVEELKSNSEKIVQTTDRIKNIILGLRSFSRNGGQDPMSEVTIKQIVDGTLALCREKFVNNRVRLDVDEVPDLVIRARGVQISQVLLNLLNNAYDAVSAHENSWVRLQFFDHNDDVRIVVSDSGPGISAEVRAKIFQPFYTTKSIGQGTGLGLSISKGLIEAHKGTLTYHESARNTTFVICLPKAA